VHAYTLNIGDYNFQSCRAKLDKNARLAQFCHDLEAACVDSVEQGFMTKDLALCVKGSLDQYVVVGC